MTDTPTRWRWNRTATDGETPRLSVSGIQSRLRGLAARWAGESGTGEREQPGTIRSFVFRPTPAMGSWEQAAIGGVATWHGGQSAASRMTIRLIEAGDEALLLNGDRRRTLVGVARVVGAAYPAPTLDEPSRLAINLELICRLAPVIALNRLRTEPRMHDSALLRAPTPELVRLSPDQRHALKRYGVD